MRLLTARRRTERRNAKSSTLVKRIQTSDRSARSTERPLMMCRFSRATTLIGGPPLPLAVTLTWTPTNARKFTSSS